jgi:hypothetical protein
MKHVSIGTKRVTHKGYKFHCLVFTKNQENFNEFGLFFLVAFLPFFLIQARLGFEFRASCLLSRHSTT